MNAGSARAYSFDECAESEVFWWMRKPHTSTYAKRLRASSSFNAIQVHSKKRRRKSNSDVGTVDARNIADGEQNQLKSISVPSGSAAMRSPISRGTAIRSTPC